MEIRIRRLFSWKSTPRNKDQQLLKALPYEHTIALKAPVRGTDRVFGNGPHALEVLQRGSIVPRPPTPVSKAPAPSIPLAREDSHSKRPQTAPQSGSSQLRVRRGRIQSSLPANLHQISSGKDSPEPQPQLNSFHRKLRRDSSLQLEYNFGGSDSASQNSKSVTGYVDLLDAAATINPSRSLGQRTRASGVRSYGEDVADRNIAEFGTADLNSPQFSYLHAIYVRGGGYDIDSEVENKTDGKSHTRDGSAGSSNGSNEGFENTAESEKGSPSQLPLKDGGVYPLAESLRATAPLPSSPVATTNASAPSPSPSTTSMSLRGRRGDTAKNIDVKRAYSSVSLPISSAQQCRPLRRSSIASTKSHILSRGGEDSLSLTDLVPKSSGTLSRTSSAGSMHRGPKEKQIVNALSPSSPQPAPPRYTQALPVPPLSPIADSSPSGAGKTSSDTNRPALRRRSRGFSANYTAFPPQSPRKPGIASTSSSILSEKNIPRSTTTQNDQGKATGATPENAIDENRDSTAERNHKQRQTSEIHNYDTSPKSQPTAKLREILTNDRTGGSTGSFPKISTSASANRENNVQAIRSSSSSESVASGVDIPISRSPQRVPSITSRIKRVFPSLANSRAGKPQSPPSPTTPFPYLTDDNGDDGDGENREEITRYTAFARPGATGRRRRTSDSPVDPNLIGSFLHPLSYRPSSSPDSSPRTPTATGEENLLFKEGGYGLGGMLPGLEEPTPMSIAPGAAPQKPRGSLTPEGAGLALGQSLKPTTTLLASIEREATRAAVRRVKLERERERERRAHVTMKLKPLAR